jgi:hypothetical protein
MTAALAYSFDYTTPMATPALPSSELFTVRDAANSNLALRRKQKLGLFAQAATNLALFHAWRP